MSDQNTPYVFYDLETGTPIQASWNDLADENYRLREANEELRTLGGRVARSTLPEWDRLRRVEEVARQVEGRIHYLTEKNLCPLCQSRMGQHRDDCVLGALRRALEGSE